MVTTPLSFSPFFSFRAFLLHFTPSLLLLLLLLPLAAEAALASPSPPCPAPGSSTLSTAG